MLFEKIPSPEALDVFDCHNWVSKLNQSSGGQQSVQRTPSSHKSMMSHDKPQENIFLILSLDCMNTDRHQSHRHLKQNAHSQGDFHIYLSIY